MLTRNYREFDNLFNGLFNDFLQPSFYKESDTLSFDAEDVGHAIILETDVPGMKKEDIEVEFKDRSLSVKSFKEITEPKDKKYYLKERGSIKFNRFFNIPFYIKVEEIKCSLEHGVLRITLPKSEEHKPKKITIN